MDFKFGGYIYRANPNKSPLKILEKMERGRIQGLPIFCLPTIISGMGKAADFKFGGYIYRANPNKSQLKILEKRERGRIQELSNFFGYHLLSQERLKLRTSNFVGTFIGSIGTNAHEKCWKYVVAVGVVRKSRKYSAHPCIGRMGVFRGHLCDSTAFLLIRPRLLVTYSK